ncbi:hypothetical protein J8M20_13925 [Pseudoalteromonas luteoviolacea]|uniref:hypothetical protein n=1 Tax=Pseudoalteromonas luteoviolacea TaxID=43657 RepID=UPI001B38C0DD|nr:hypothetical protein [Pseudoalteromonas luteoviolacea]MBQ4812451.1 hypothetical protein [Pseudoalteromonas luteoviolacea]
MKQLIVLILLLLPTAVFSAEPKDICDENITMSTSVNDAIDIQKKCQVEKNLQLIREKSNYDRFSLMHRQSTQEYQYTTSIIIFSLVVVIVIFGLVFSWLEFKKGKDSTTTLKFSSNGIEISSQIIGLIVLVISLGFAYIYIDKAYPINEIGSNNTSSNK